MERDPLTGPAATDPYVPCAAADPYTALRHFIANPPKNAALVFATGWHVIAAELMKRMLAVVDAAEALSWSDDRSTEFVQIQAAWDTLRAALAELKRTVNRRPAPEPTHTEL